MSNDGDESIVICRGCMNECIEYKSIYKEGVIMDEVTTLAKILRQLTELDFLEYEDNLPAQLCLKCVQALAKAYSFRKMVLRTNSALRQFTEDCSDIKQSPQTNEGNADYSNEVTKHLRYKSGTDAGKGNYENIEFITNEIEDGNNYVTMAVLTDHSVVNMEVYQSENDTNDTAQQLEQEHEQEHDPEIEHEQQQDDQYELHQLEDVEEEEVVVHEVVEECDLNDISDFENDNSQLSIVKIEDNTMEAYEITLDNSENTSNSTDLEHQLQQQHEALDAYEIEYIKKGLQMETSSPKTQKLKIRKDQHSSSFFQHNTDKLIGVSSRDNDSKKEKNPNFKCKKCGKQLSNAGSFKYHMQLHSDKKPYLCSLCGEGFKTRNAYDGHMSSHNPNNPNTCHICGKSYRQPSSLRAHMLTHTGEKPFQCEICGKGLTQKSGYKKHLLTHTDEKPHECDICGREFRYSSNLIAHKRIHNANKPHKCTECSKSFTTLEQMERHRTTYHELGHQCDLCPKRFRRRLSMIAHMNTDHTADNFDPKLSKSNVVELL